MGKAWLEQRIVKDTQGPGVCFWGTESQGAEERQALAALSPGANKHAFSGALVWADSVHRPLICSRPALATLSQGTPVTKQPLPYLLHLPSFLSNPCITQFLGVRGWYLYMISEWVLLRISGEISK